MLPSFTITHDIIISHLCYLLRVLNAASLVAPHHSQHYFLYHHTSDTVFVHDHIDPAVATRSFSMEPLSQCPGHSLYITECHNQFSANTTQLEFWILPRCTIKIHWQLLQVVCFLHIYLSSSAPERHMATTSPLDRRGETSCASLHCQLYLQQLVFGLHGCRQPGGVHGRAM